MKSINVILFLLMGFFGAGCGSAGRPAMSPHGVDDENFNAMWDAATEVLGKYRFTIDRADRRAGVITTFPMTGRHWFEFWRKDAATPRDVTEGTLQTIYRRVTVNIRRKEAGGKEYLVAVQVHTTRSDLPNPQVTSTSEAYNLFLNPDMPRSASLTGLGGPSGSKSVPLGRDENLEEILRQQIHQLAAKKLTIFPR